MRSPVSRIASLLLAALWLPALGACGGPQIYKLYPGPERPPAELATVDFGYILHDQDLLIDGMLIKRSDYDTILLLPGLYRLELQRHADGKREPVPAVRGAPANAPVVKLEAGLVYLIDKTIVSDCHLWLCVLLPESGLTVVDWVAP